MSQKNISIGITGFLDVLGFGDRVLNARKFADIDAITRDIRKIQSEFDFKTKDKLTKEVHENYKKTVLAFSDSVIVNIPLQSEMTELEGTFDPLIEALHGKGVSSDGVLTANALMTYVYTRVANDKYSNQSPHYGYIDGDGDMVLLAS